MTTRYTAIPVSDLPYPPGLGKIEYDSLERNMRQLMKRHYSDASAHAKVFWFAEYQALLSTHLAPAFDEIGPIEEIAREALARAQTSPAFDRDLPGEGVVADDVYRAPFGPKPPYPELTATQAAVEEWLRYPPRLYYRSNGDLIIGDGRHRLSYLRSRVQVADPTFPVLVVVISD